MMTREDQIAFMEGCRDRIRGYVSHWLSRPVVRSAFQHHRQEPQDDPSPADAHDEPSRRFG